MNVDYELSLQQLLPAVTRVFELAAVKTRQLDEQWDPQHGAPVFTAAGRYTTRGWTEWTQGFQYGCLILTGDALDDRELIELGRARTVERMLPHVTHIGVHDHGFNNLSTYGNLLRLLDEGRMDDNPWERRTYENAIAVSGAVQAARWAPTHCGLGYICSFNGPHSLFIDTMRTTRILGVAHQLGHALMAENDQCVNLLGRSIQHGLATSKYIVFHGDSTHTYDVRGRTGMKGRLTVPTDVFEPGLRSKVIHLSRPGRADWPGPCWDTPKSLSFSRLCRQNNSPLLDHSPRMR